MKKFKSLKWYKTGVGDTERADIEIRISGNYELYHLYSVFTDNAGIVHATCLDKGLFGLSKSDLLTIDNAKTVAEREYQKAMNILFEELEKHIA